MAGGLAALLDDIAALAKLAAASTDDVAAASARASVKAAGVVVDDAAVTPQYVQGIDPKRELPIIWRITLGSLRNKLLIILPVALLLSEVAPWLLTPILMLGGTYLCFEGAEKILELVTGHTEEKAAAEQGPEAEKRIISGAVRTDLILSAEIMVISLNEVMQETIWHRLAPWPDTCAGLRALGEQGYATCTLSNGNLSLLQDMVAAAAMPFTHLFSAEMFQSYKPSPRVYLGAAERMGLRPGQCALVAAHLSLWAAATTKPTLSSKCSPWISAANQSAAKLSGANRL